MGTGRRRATTRVRRAVVGLAALGGLTASVAAVVAVVLVVLPGGVAAPAGDPLPTVRSTPAVTAAGTTALGDWTCTDDLRTSAQSPVLLVHGVSLSAEENWGATLAPYLVARGHAVCLVALLGHGTSDVQDNIEVVVRAIRAVSAEAGRPVDVIGHSLGAYLPRAALRLHPDLVPDVDDIVGLAGVYDLGSEQLVSRCAGPCVPALHQMARHSALLRAIARRPLPSGPSYSNVGSGGDLSVTPQPRANEQSGTTAVLLQDVCPGRQLSGHDHALLVGDAVAAALIVDALDHPGPVDPVRVPDATCAQTWYDGFDPDAFLDVVSKATGRLRSGQVDAEPPVDCRLRSDCRDPAARGRLLSGVSWRVSAARVVLRATATGAGSVRLSVGDVTVARRVREGQAVTLRLDRPGPGGTATLATLPRYYDDYVAEARLPLRRR